MTGQVWAVDTLGGYAYSDNLSEKLRQALQPIVKFRQFCDVKDATQQGKSKGDTYHWNVYSDVSTQGTTLIETNTMPETNFTITQGTLTITEMGNSVPYTAKLDDLSEHPVTEIINKALKNDAKKAFDGAAHDQFNNTPIRIVPTAGTDTSAITLTSDGTATLTNNVALGKAHVKTIVDTLKERNVPAYQADDYMALGRPSTWRSFKNELETVHQYVDAGFRMILNGEIGRYEGMRFFEQTEILAGVANGGTAWSNGKSDWAYFFGSDTVAEAIAVPEEMRGKIPTDFGRGRGVAWYYLGGFGLVHTLQMGATQARILKWDSAA